MDKKMDKKTLSFLSRFISNTKRFLCQWQTTLVLSKMQTVISLEEQQCKTIKGTDLVREMDNRGLFCSSAFSAKQTQCNQTSTDHKLLAGLFFTRRSDFSGGI